MRILELFSGTGSLAKIARARGYEVVTLDICPKHSPTICTDLLEWDPSVFPPDNFGYVHASCPCEAYSLARTTGGPRPMHSSKRRSPCLDTSVRQNGLWRIRRAHSSGNASSHALYSSRSLKPVIVFMDFHIEKILGLRITLDLS